MISKVETESEGSLHRRKVEHTFEYTLIALHSTMCIVNHFVLEQIASLAVTGTEWNTLAILRIISISLPFFFFFFPFVISSLGEIWSTRVLRRSTHHVGNHVLRDDFVSWLRFMAAKRREINRGGELIGEGGATRTATGTPDELVDLGN